MHTFASVLTHKHFIVCSSTVNQTGTPLETSYLVAAIGLTEIGQLIVSLFSKVYLGGYCEKSLSHKLHIYIF